MIKMTVMDLVSLCIDNHKTEYELWDIENDELIFKGDCSEIPKEILDEEIGSFNSPQKDLFRVNVIHYGN